MRVAVTGANGFLGRHVIEQLAPLGHVRALTRKAYSWPEGIESCVLQFREEHLRGSLDDCDVLVHLAARRLYRRADGEKSQNLDLDGLVFEAAKQAGIGRVIFASTCGVYGKQPTPWLETDSLAPENSYSSEKQKAELLLQDSIAPNCIVILRLSQLFGLGEYEGSAISTFLRKAANCQPIEVTVSDLWREYTYVRDAARAIAMAATPGNAVGIFNVGSSELLSIEGIARTIEGAFGRQDLVKVAPKTTKVGERSLMNSKKFRGAFNWAPQWTFEEAAQDVARQFLTQSLRISHVH